MRRQCKNKSNCFQLLTSWIPSNIAKVGNIVKLKEFSSDKKWSDGWEILTVGRKCSGCKIEIESIDYRHQRKMSDI